MTDQVSPLASLGSGSPVMLPSAAITAAVSKNPSSNATSAVPASAAAKAAQPEAGSAQPAKNASVDPQTMNAQLQQANSSLQFKVDQSTGISYFKVVDSTTGKTIRQVPSADAIAMAQKLQDFSKHQNPSGILMDEEG